MKKEEVLSKVEANPNMSKGELKMLINSISLKGTIKLATIKPGDIFACKSLSHPALVLKKLNNNYVCMLLTTTPHDYILITKLENRFIEVEQFVTNAIIIADFENISKNYMCTIETKELNRVKKLFKDFVIKLL